MFKQFRRWAESGVFEGLFNAISGEPDLEYALIDGVQARQKASGAKEGLGIGRLGRSRRGLTIRIVALVDAPGNLLRFLLLHR